MSNCIIDNKLIKNTMNYRKNYGVSDYSAYIQKEVDELSSSLAKTTSFGGNFINILEELLQAKREQRTNNWDGYGAKGINTNSFNKAMKFALSLPFDIPIPIISVIPSGNIMFTWSKHKRRLLSIIISEKNELSYASLIGMDKTYGVLHFQENIPSIILDNINMIYSI